MLNLLLIRNFLLFQLGWFACVLGGAYQLPLIGSGIAALFLALHLWSAADAFAELKLLLIALLLGLMFESLMVGLQLANYSNGMLLSGLAPHWMLMLWPLFASTLNLSLGWIKTLAPGWVALLGAVSAPFAYFAGARLQAVVFDDLLLSLSMIALGWALLLPLLVMAAGRFNGFAYRQPAVVEKAATSGGLDNV